MTAQAHEDRQQLASDADHAAGLAWRAGDLARAVKLISAARALDPDRAEVWAQREAAISESAATAGQPAPKAPTPFRPSVRPGFCPGCRTAQLTHGREVCQACGALRLIRGRDAETEAGR